MLCSSATGWSKALGDRWAVLSPLFSSPMDRPRKRREKGKANDYQKRDSPNI